MKPTTTFQIFNQATGMLSVFNGDDTTSGLYYHGLPENYDGTATDPVSPTSEYILKQTEKEVE